jgi:hypothetical protein
MPATVIDSMATPWSSSTPALQVVVAPTGASDPGTSNRFSAPLGAVGAMATFTPVAPLDLSAFDELRFWVRADRRADGTAGAPFWLELSYRDTGDLPTEEHRWFVAINAADTWEQRRIGIAGDRRSAIDRLRFTALDDRSFSIFVDDLLAVEERPIADLETALVGRVGESLAIPGLVDVALTQTANPGAATISVPAAAPFAAGNEILITGGSAGSQTREVTGVAPAAGATVLTLGQPVVGTLTAGVATVTVLVPVVVEAPPTPIAHPVPAVVITPLGVTEDLERTRNTQQRDSFRPRGSRVACSVRPGARAYLCDYQITVVAIDRSQQTAVADQILPRLSSNVPLRVNGALWPVWTMAALPLLNREFGTLAPATYVRIGARAEIAPRVEAPWVQRLHVGAGRPDAPADTEAIVIRL